MDSAKYRTYGKIQEQLFPLGLGTMRLELPHNGQKIADSKAAQVIRYAIDRGVNYIDTAYNYMNGFCEPVVGEALGEGYRSKVFLATKSPVWLLQKKQDFSGYLEKQLERLHTDEIDFYLLHGLDRQLWENKILKFDVLSEMEKAKRMGKIGYFGFSFHDKLSVFRKILNCGLPWDFCQIQLNYLDTDFQAGVQGMREAYKKGVGVSVMEPLRGGTLANLDAELTEMIEKTGRTPAGFALDYLWDFPEISIVLSGMRSKKEIDKNIDFALHHQPFQAQEKELIFTIKEKMHLLGEIPCTSCSYCADCPGGIPISDVFVLFNDYQKKKNIQRLMYLLEQSQIGEGCKKWMCMKCGHCNYRCPQKVDVMNEIERVMDFYREVQRRKIYYANSST